MSIAEPAPARTSSATSSTWAPLQNTVFRVLWFAVLASNIGTWMQTVGAQWLLVADPHASTLVALVQTGGGWHPYWLLETALPFPENFRSRPVAAASALFRDRRRHCVVQRLIHLSTHPEPVQ